MDRKKGCMNRMESIASNNEGIDKREKENEENYVFIDEKYKEFFDTMSDIFEDKIEYILNKHFKKNDPKNKNKLVCLNVCVLWLKKYLLLLSRSLNDYEQYLKENNELIQDDSKINISVNEESASQNTKVVEKDFKSFIKNVKIVDNQNIEVIYDSNDINDNRPSAELSTEELYYLLVESKKSENEYKKKIYTFLSYLPLFIKSIEDKNFLEKKILEEKLLIKEGNQNGNPSDANEMNVANRNMNLDMNMNANINMNHNEMESLNISPMEIQDKLNAIVNFDFNLSENLETLFKNDLSNKSNDYKNSFLSGNNKDAMEETKQTNHMNEFTTNGLYDTNNKQNKSVVMPLSKINDLSLINNVSNKSLRGIEDGNENELAQEQENSFYIYKNHMDTTNLYGLDILTNLNNNLIYKINHIYSLIEFYTMLAKDVFNET